MTARHQFHRIGNDLTADQRRLHALCACGDAIINGDRVDFQWGAAGSPDAVHHLGRELAMVPVTRHCADPAVGHTHLWAL